MTIENLMEMHNWVAWTKIERDGKPTKLPINPKTGGNAMPNNPDTWSDYQATVNYASDKGLDGVGFMFTPVNDEEVLFGVDIDVHNGDNPLTDGIMKLFSGTYIEHSPSGNGVHIIGRAKMDKLPIIWDDKDQKYRLDPKYYQKNPKIDVECYVAGVTNRYFTYTGNQISTSNIIADKTDELLAFLDKYMIRISSAPLPKDTLKTTNRFTIPAISVASMNTNELIDKARHSNNGSKFIALYDRGDLTGYNSQSEADLALCNMLAFWLKGDPMKIDEAFRCSALYRSDKWERPDYREATISKAIARCEGRFYDPGYYASTPITYTNVLSANADAQRKEQFINDLVETSDKNNKLAAFRQKSPHFVKLRLDEKSGKYYPIGIDCPKLADFIRDHNEFFFVRHSSDNNYIVYLYEHGTYKIIDENELKGIIKEPIMQYAPELLKMRDINEVYSNLMTDRNRFKKETDFNANENIICFNNGVLFLDSMILKPHSPQYLLTIKINIDWNCTGMDINTPVFDKFMYEFSGGDPDITECLLQYLGICLSNIHGYRFKKALFVYGESNCGKSVLREFAEKMIGEENCSAGNLAQLNDKFGAAELFGKRIYGSADISAATAKELDVFKQVVGRDPVQMQFKFKGLFNYKYLGLLWFGCNFFPKFGGSKGDDVYNRMLFIQAHRGQRIDKELGNKLLKEANGIVYKAIMAAKRAVDNDYTFTEPACSKQLLKEFRLENSGYLTFYQECCVPRNRYGAIECSNAQVTKAALWLVAKQFIKDHFGFDGKQADFIKELEQNGIDTSLKKTQGYTYYRAFTLRNEIIETYAYLLPTYKDSKKAVDETNNGNNGFPF